MPEDDHVHINEAVPAGLLRLPTELLLGILKDLDQADLHSLSLLSRRLHNIALPLLLARQGLPDVMSLHSGKLTLSELTFLALPALRTALFVTSVKHLFCKFNAPDFDDLRSTSIHHGWLCSTGIDISNMKRFVSRLSHIEEVTLDLGRLNNWCRNNYNASCLRELLETFTSISVKLTVNSDPHWLSRPPLSWNDSSHPTLQSVSAAPKLMERMGALTRIGLSGLRSTKKPSANISKRSTVKNFAINAARLFQEPVLYEWTMGTLNTSHLVSLTIHISSLPQLSLGTILPQISIPTLREFAVNCGTSFDCLADFLTRHRNVTALTIGNEVFHPNPSHRLPKSFLSQLTSLHAVPEFIFYLLGPSRTLPDLRYISVLSYTPIGPYIDLAVIDQTLSPIMHRFQDAVISLELLVVSDNVQSVSLDALADSPLVGGSGQWLRRVTSLKLKLTAALPAVFGGDALHFFPSWLMAFPPSLEHVSLVGAWFASTERRARVSLVRLINGAYPGVRTVTLNEERRSVSAWLVGD